MEKLTAILFAVTSVVALALTVYDKLAAIKGRRRIPEKVLMTVGFFGGAVVMYGAMQIIRHKTQHKKFMIGLPLFILFHVAIIAAVFLL